MTDNGAQTTWKAIDLKIIFNSERTHIKQDVMIWTKAQDVGLHIGTVMWATEWANVGSLGVRSHWGFKALSTNLTPVVVKNLDSVCSLGTTDQS